MRNLYTSKPLRARLVLSLLAGWVALFLIAIRVYEGNPFVYMVFSITFIALLTSALVMQRTYGYTFLAIFLFLGFWFKVSWHLAWGNGYPEPTGYFNGSASHWDHALIVSTIGAFAVLAGRLLYEISAGQRRVSLNEIAMPPRWLATTRRWHWALFLLTVAAVAIANHNYQIFVVGFKVGTILAWPLNALITLMLVGGGFAIWMAALLWYEIQWRGAVFHVMVVLVIAALMLTTSMLSRGMIVMLLAPIAYAVYKNVKLLSDFSNKNLWRVSIVVVLLVYGNFFVVNQMRDNAYFEKKRAL